MAEAKTNAMRMMERAKVPYKVHTYEHGDGKIDGWSVAQKVGRDPSQLFKTLVTKGSSGQYFVFVIPVSKELRLKAAARSVGEKSVEMIPVADINRVTGYIRGGCSPVGMKKQYVTVIDQSARNWDTIVVSAGKIGFQAELSPEDLARLTGADFAVIAEE